MATSNSRASLADVNSGLGRLRAQERISSVLQHFGSGVVMTTSFGKNSAILLDLATSVSPNMIVVYIDHGCWRDPEAQAKFVAECVKRFNLNLVIIRPKEDISYSDVLRTLQRLSDGEDAAVELDRLRHVGKIEPLERALSNLGARVWITGVSGYETESRSKFDIIMKRQTFYKLHPILDWTREMKDAYLKERGLPVNDGYYDVFKGREDSECGLQTADLTVVRRGVTEL